MRRFILFTILWCFSILIYAQNADNKYLIKYLETNTAQPDYGVTFLNDNQFIFKSPNTEKINTNSQKLSESNLFLATLGEGGDIIEKKEINGLPTNKITKTGATFSSNNKIVYYSAKKYRKTPKRKDKEQLFKAEIDSEGNWINIEKLPFSKDKYSFGEPSLSHSGKELYFTSDMPASLGGLDIFMVTINTDGSFGEPINLGKKINTSGNEVTPYITKNSKLYFSSDSHNEGLGNLDVYSIDIKNPTANVEHLDAPINSLNDDFAFIINKNDDKGYFSSNRLQGQNNHDIYSFLVEKIKEDGPCVQEITGIVKDNATQEILRNAIITLLDEENNELDQIKTDDTGKYTISLDCNKTYTIKAGAENYNTEDHIVNTANYLDAPTLEANKFLIQKSIEEIDEQANLISEKQSEVDEDKTETYTNSSSIEDDEATINALYFDFDKSIITEKAAKELDKLSEILRNNENIHVELSSYTDSRGNSDYNLKLSQRRANASADYLVSQGIDRSRIKAKGYGESKMVNKCIDGIECSEAAHEKNRRTEIAFINPQASVDNFDNTTVINKEESVKNIEEKEPKKIAQSSDHSNSEKVENLIEENKAIEEPIETKVTEVYKPSTPISSGRTLKEDVTETSTLVNVKEDLKNETDIETNAIKISEENTIEKSTIIEEELSDEAKWLNNELEKNNKENIQIKTIEVEEMNKPQLIEPITEASQRTQ